MIRGRIRRSPALLHLALRGPSQADDCLLEWLMAERPLLATIDMSFCMQLTSRSLTLLAVGGQRRRGLSVRGCFWEPHPHLTPMDVLRNQLYGLRMNSADGIARCFGLASPSNRAWTGPLPRFAQMIRRGFPIMLNHLSAYIKTPPMHAPSSALHKEGLQREDHERPSVQFRVVFVGAASSGRNSRGGNAIEEYLWLLDRQPSDADEAPGCWMTNGVAPMELDEVVRSLFFTNLFVPGGEECLARKGYQNLGPMPWA